MVRRSIAAFALSLLVTSTAMAAQTSGGIPIGSGPGGVPFGAGTQRGLQGMNNSGQNGFITLFDRGARTAVVVAIEGANGRRERAQIERGSSCDDVFKRFHVLARLNDVTGGFSRGYVQVPLKSLMSGNYLAVVYGNRTLFSRPVACGELYN
jgi:hypothetical protein